MNDSASSQVFQSREPPANSTTPEEFIRMTKGITNATAKAVAAGNSGQQEDIISTANLSRKAITDMLTTCKVRDTDITTLLVLLEYMTSHCFFITCSHVINEWKKYNSRQTVKTTCDPRKMGISLMQMSDYSTCSMLWVFR